MSAKIIDGNVLAREIRAEWKARSDLLTEQGMQPGLAVIIVGSNPASSIYVRNKARACDEAGIHSEIHSFPESTNQNEVILRIRELNADPRIHGILVQLPLPNHFESREIIASISVEKDVDGFHLYNVGALVTGNTVFPPCTPFGVIKMLEKNNIAIEGRHAVVVGRSNIVGKPMALMLLERGATIRPHMITSDMVKPGAAVIDVGINRMPDGKLTGDVDFESVKEVAGHLTPVPGGVGPMTISMLLCSTIAAAERALARA